LMDQSVYFQLKSDGYIFPADSFGYHGLGLHVRRGGKDVVKINRLNIAERLYRITGTGIYRDSVLLGEKVPLDHPVVDGLVTGQDSVMMTPYNGKVYWFYGDTGKLEYPLGQYWTSGATSLLPGKGGLDPSKGVNLAYWVDKKGFSRAMAPMSAVGDIRGP